MLMTDTCSKESPGEGGQEKAVGILPSHIHTAAFSTEFWEQSSWHIMAFWGLEIQPGKLVPYVPPPESARLRLSNACLDDSAVTGEAKADLSCKTSDGPQLRLCCLRSSTKDSTTLDLMFDGYTEFLAEGNAPVHLTGD